jgi:taurine dioxygenase
MTLDIIPTGAAAGAEICGVDLTNTLDENAYQTLNRALGEHGVIFFRGQSLSPEQHMAIQDYALPNCRLMHRTTFAATGAPA